MIRSFGDRHRLVRRERFGPTPSEYVQAFTPAVIGLLVAALLLSATVSAHRVVPVTVVGVVVAGLALASAVLEFRDLPRRELRVDERQIVVAHSGHDALRLGLGELALVQLVTVPAPLWRVVPRHRVWLECQALGGATSFDRLHPDAGGYEPAGDDAAHGGLRVDFGCGRGRLDELDALLRSAGGLYCGIRHEAAEKPKRISRPEQRGQRRGSATTAQGRTRGPSQRP